MRVENRADLLEFTAAVNRVAGSLPHAQCECSLVYSGDAIMSCMA